MPREAYSVYDCGSQSPLADVLSAPYKRVAIKLAPSVIGSEALRSLTLKMLEVLLYARLGQHEQHRRISIPEAGNNHCVGRPDLHGSVPTQWSPRESQARTDPVEGDQDSCGYSRQRGSSPILSTSISIGQRNRIWIESEVSHVVAV